MTRYYSRSASLHLKGNWLEAAGFEIDTRCHQHLARPTADPYCG
ncbi:SymE family type I addiction module toxin [Pectobacterium sp. CHL-2024]